MKIWILEGSGFNAGRELEDLLRRRPRSDGYVGCVYIFFEMVSRGIIASRALDRLEPFGVDGLFGYREAGAAIAVALPESVLRSRNHRRESRDPVLVASAIPGPAFDWPSPAFVAETVRRNQHGRKTSWNV